MHLRNLKPYILILRPGIFVGSFALVILSTIVATNKGFPFVAAILGAAGVAVTGAAGSVINDRFDVVGDKKNNPQRVLPSGLLTKGQALCYYWILLAVSLGLLGFVNTWALAIGAVTSLMLFLYSYKVREWNGLASNIVIALSLGGVLAFGAVITEHFTKQIAFLFGFGFCTGLAREILGDIVNIEGDAQQGNLRTLPITKGVSLSRLVVSLILLAVAGLGALPFVTDLFESPFLASGPFLISVLAVSICLKQLREDKLRKAQTLLKGLLFVFTVAVVLSTVL